MTAIAFDTHAFVKQLTQAGMPEQQAEILADTHASLINEELATKNDLKQLEMSLAHQLTLRLGAMLVVGIGVVASLVKLL